MPLELRGRPYVEQWEKCSTESWFDAVLRDGSLLQFRRYDDRLSYSFHDCPFAYQSFEDFAFEQAGEDWRDYADVLAEEYELARSSEMTERPATPIRYDFEPHLYTCGRHPAGHIHFGFERALLSNSA
ncbi:DUF2290 domain-containing protein [Rubellimicrobium mesophilum]|uniref:DUF2290 domain-containing protein n=1 Tax=Rubellimicrobium mesophilum TaxID=1123067 RepID=UPI003CCC249B